MFYGSFERFDAAEVAIDDFDRWLVHHVPTLSLRDFSFARVNDFFRYLGRNSRQQLAYLIAFKDQDGNMTAVECHVGFSVDGKIVPTINVKSPVIHNMVTYEGFEREFKRYTLR